MVDLDLRHRRGAQERGWSHQANTYGLVDRLCGMAPLPKRGSNLHGRHYITGEYRGRGFCCFEYTTGTGGVNDGPGNAQATFWTVFAVTAPGPGPELVVRRPQALDGMTQRGRMVELGVPEFDEAFTRTALTGGVVPFLATDPPAGKDSLIWLHVDERLTYLCDVLDRIPPQVWSTV